MDPSLLVRKNYVPKSCFLHYRDDPIKLVKGEKQYLISDSGEKYLDCANSVAHVGHCHPRIVETGLRYFENLTIPAEESRSYDDYCKELLRELPPHFDTVLFVNSGSEANDLAIQIAQNYADSKDVIAVSGSFYGDISYSNFVSSKNSETNRRVPKPWVHSIPCPDIYRGKYTDQSTAAKSYGFEGIKIINSLLQKGIKICGFISEPILTTCGVIIPPSGWLEMITNHIISLNGLIIVDETNTGLGRTGKAMWGFQLEQINPHIITIGKPLGSGYPVAAVITNSIIFQSCRMDKTKFVSSLLSARIGLCTLRIIREENLIARAAKIGKTIFEKLLQLKEKYHCIGDVRGVGCILAVEIVFNSETDIRPAPKIAQDIVNRLKENRVLLSNEGEFKNILILLPSLIFTSIEIDLIISALDYVLSSLQQSFICYQDYEQINIAEYENNGLSHFTSSLINDDVD